jgi:hypothetical protein
MMLMRIWNYMTADRITALATAAGVIVAVWGLISQLASSRFAISVDLLGKMDERFNSPGMLQKRREAATALLNKKDNGEVDDILDFFETVGLMMHRGALDEEMVWNTFFYWVDGYWRSAQPYIQSERRDDPVVWTEVEYLEERCLAFEKRKVEGKGLGEVPIQEFLTYEAQLSGEQGINQRQKHPPRRHGGRR